MKTRSKSKFQSVDIIRDNQPLNYRQFSGNINNNDEQQQQQLQNQDDDEDDWEEGCIQSSSTSNQNNNKNDFNVNNDDKNEGVKIEFDALPESPKKKRIRRATAEDKEFAELVHKVHLLCLIARGRLIDAACDDPLIQAALLSLLPPHLLKISEASNLTASDLTPVVTWFHQNFHVRRPNSEEKQFDSALANALEAQGGSPEEVAALSVALFRALTFTTRFVSALDVASLKPEADGDELSYLDTGGERKNIFNSSTLMVSKMNTGQISSTKSTASNGKNIHDLHAEAKVGVLPSNVDVKDDIKDSFASDLLESSDQVADETQAASEDDKNRKRKGDLEFEMQLQMAMAATSLVAPERKLETSSSGSPSSPLVSLSPLKRIKRISEESSSSSHGISTAIGSRKVGAPLFWAEVYCSGENLTGKWVHIDAVNAIVDGELKVEAAATACKKSLRYVVAFAGHGAKDVTRRYCAKWYTISPKRINSDWWDAVIAPLKELESRETGGMVPLHEQVMKATDRVAGKSTHGKSSFSGSCVNVGKDSQKSSTHRSIHSRSTLEDMELATRALTEPLPTNQQAYKNHPLYAIEKWLTKYQILHPKGPILGFCSGHAVYPRTCVQILHTKERWLREGLQVKENELPSKVVKKCSRNRRGQAIEVEGSREGGSDEVVSLFGKWQTEPLCLPPAVDGIVPKNERGQVDVWSEKCLPPGTVHLRFPRLVPVAKKLGINFAPAMVGFEFRNGRSIPVYEGIVVCTEFREVILEAYAEEEQRRQEEERKKEERQALSRWYQLLSSMVIRQRLNNAYMNNSETATVAKPLKSDSKSSCTGTPNLNGSVVSHRENVHGTKIPDSDWTHTHNHEHVFLTYDDGCDKDSMIRTKRCHCGVSIEVEEL